MKPRRSSVVIAENVATGDHLLRLIDLFARIPRRVLLIAALLSPVAFLPSCGGLSDKDGYEFARVLIGR
jgi:hypothetical protein